MYGDGENPPSGGWSLRGRAGRLGGLMTPHTLAIRSEPHVEIGSIILRSADVLVERWCERALTHHANAVRVHDEALRNQLGPFLRSVGRGLIQAGDGEPVDHRDDALDHGEQRWDSGWSLTEVVRDYQLLQLIILEHLEKELARPLRYREVMAVGVFIDDAVAASIAAYVANRDLHFRELDRDRVNTLREADRRKDDFLAQVVHELRNPLAPIVNATRSLRLMLPNADSAVGDTIRVIRRQTRQLARLLDDLSDLTRIVQGTMQLRRTVVDVADVIEQAVQTSAPELEKRAHRLVVRPSSEKLRVEGDAVRLVQALVNLLNNAAKYTPPGGEVVLSAQRSGEKVEIRVKDTGIGIDPGMIPKLFELYARAGESDGSPDGLGIGLSLVSELVALHGGSIECFSAGAGQGAEFLITLTAYEGPVPSESTTPPRPMDIRSRRLLIVEDDADGRESLTTLLRLMGHEVESAPDAARGIETALAGEFDAALIDIGLPDRSGYEVAMELRNQMTDPIFLIALTGYSLADDVQRALASGFDAHMVKPLDTEEFGRLLAKGRPQS